MSKLKLSWPTTQTKPRCAICLKRFRFRICRVDVLVNLNCCHPLLLYLWMIRAGYLLWKFYIMLSRALWVGSRPQLSVVDKPDSPLREIVAEPYFKVPFRTRYRWCGLHYWRGNNFKRMCVFRYVGLSAYPSPPPISKTTTHHHPQSMDTRKVHLIQRLRLLYWLMISVTYQSH